METDHLLRFAKTPTIRSPCYTTGRMSASSKFCVFCGEAPESKNKEHIIPRWLLEMTGDPSRKVFLGIDHTRNPPSIRSFAFDAFTFPACKGCNEGFSEFESSAKAIIQKASR